MCALSIWLVALDVAQLVLANSSTNGLRLFVVGSCFMLHDASLIFHVVLEGPHESAVEDD